MDSKKLRQVFEYVSQAKQKQIAAKEPDALPIMQQVRELMFSNASKLNSTTASMLLADLLAEAIWREVLDAVERGDATDAHSLMGYLYGIIVSYLGESTCTILVKAATTGGETNEQERTEPSKGQRTNR